VAGRGAGLRAHGGAERAARSARVGRGDGAPRRSSRVSRFRTAG
jgi:hypothetical protein